MNRLLILISICISASACSRARETVQPSQIMGNWYFIDDLIYGGQERESGNYYGYHEVYIDSSKINFYLGVGHGLVLFSEYEIKSDTLYLNNTYTINGIKPIWVFKKVSADKMIVELFNFRKEYQGALEFIRLNKGEKGAFDYDDYEEYFNNDSTFDDKEYAPNKGLHSLDIDFQRRFEGYLVRAGYTTWEEIEKQRIDTTNVMMLPSF